MRRIVLAGAIVALALLSVQEWGCGPKEGPCGANYNCPTGQYCVQGKCVDNAPYVEPGPTDSGDKPEPQPKPEPRPKPEPKPEPEPVTCGSNNDCTDDAKPVCYLRECIKGYASFDFSKGAPVTNPNKPLTACTSNAQCETSWQGCSSGYCRSKIQQASSAKGKYLDEGISLTDYSTVAADTIDGKPYVQIIMLTNFSDRLDKMIRIDIPVSMMKKGDIQIDGTNVRAGFYNIHSEFSPSRTLPVAMATGGSVTITTAGTKAGETVAGSAVLVFK